MDTTLTRLQKKLERWELEHLRQHAADLSNRLDLAEEQARQERTNCDYWQGRAEEIWRDLTEQGGTLGLTMDGRVMALASQTLVTDALDKAEAFLVGFEDDPDQAVVPVALATIRAALNAIRGGEEK